MSKKCLKCGYLRTQIDNVPDHECPNCGAIYAKVEAALKNAAAISITETIQTPKSPPRQTSGNPQGFISSLIQIGQKEKNAIFLLALLGFLLLVISLIFIGLSIFTGSGGPLVSALILGIPGLSALYLAWARFERSKKHTASPSSNGEHIATNILKFSGGVIGFFSVFAAVIHFGSKIYSGEESTANVSQAISLCEDYVKTHANHPSTVEFSKFTDLATKKHENGRISISSSFTAKNSFNLTLKYNIHCLVGNGNIIEANISELR